LIGSTPVVTVVNPLAGNSHIEADATNGTYDDAFDMSLSANYENGKRLTNEDKRYNVLRALANPKYQLLSDRELAEKCKVSHMTVNRIRAEFVTMLHSDQPSPKPDKPDESAELRKQVEYYEKLAKEQESQLLELAQTKRAFQEVVFDRNQARESQRKLEKEVEALKNSRPEPEIIEKVVEVEPDPEEIERLADERAAEKIAELDLKKLEDEYKLLETKKNHLTAEIAAESVVEKLRKRLNGERDAFIHGAEVLRIVTYDILERDDCAGMTVEELEQLEADVAKVNICTRELIPAIHELIEKIKKGGALRIV
jgi:hypothetical protein